MTEEKKASPPKIKRLGKEMPHKQHAGDLGCTTCPTFGEHKTVMPKSPTECKKCHEE